MTPALLHERVATTFGHDDPDHLQAVLEIAGCGAASRAMACAMLAEAGSLGAALMLRRSWLSRIGISETVLRNLSTLKAAHAAALRRVTEERLRVSCRDAALDYLHATMAHLQYEVFTVLFLDCRHRLIRDEVVASGTVDQCFPEKREILFRALELAASFLVLAHNHPSGALQPSRGDIVATKAIADAARGLDIHVDDHLIVGRGGHFSFREAGML